MLKKEIIIKRKVIQARDAAELVDLSNGFKSRIFLEMDQSNINAKSIIGVLSLCASYDQSIVLSVDGEDQQEAMDKLSSWFTGRV